jgi:hypothetical protein
MIASSVDRFARFTEAARKALMLAQQEAQGAHRRDVGSEHLLLGLLDNPSGEAAVALRGLGVEEAAVRQALAREMERAATGESPSPVAQADGLKRIFSHAFEAASGEGVEHVGTMHLLVGLLRDGGGVASRVLGGMGVNVPQVQALRAGHGAGPTSTTGWPQPGDRVLVHDPEPPYRLWEGMVTSRAGNEVGVTVEGHPTRTASTLAPWELHPIPAHSTQGCARCKSRVTSS